MTKNKTSDTLITLGISILLASIVLLSIKVQWDSIQGWFNLQVQDIQSFEP